MKIRLSDYLADFVAGMGVRSVYAVTGGGAMFLNDALGFHRDFGMVCFHHEQSAAMAAEGEARITGRPGVVHVTSGPGGTNALTGVAGAWIDSIPMLGISGQASLPTTIGTSGLRQRGVQEIDIVSIMKPVTKYAVMVEKAEDIRHHLEKAVHEAVSGKPGPTWIDVPTDIQVAMIDPAALPSFKPEAAPKVDLGPAIRQALDLIRSAERPVLIPGYGIRSAGAVEAFRELAEKLHIPIVPSWNAADIVASDNPFHIGRAGIFGDRAGNFAVQNADLLICLGSRMSVPQTGYNEKTFAREAKRIVVDIDPRELAKPTLRPDLPIAADVGAVIRGLLAALGNVQRSPKLDAWVAKCRDWQRRYPVVLPEYRAITDKVNSYVFVERLAAKLPADAAIVTDMGTSFTCTMQTFATRQGQRLFTSSGLAAMGFGLPGAIGVCCARGRKPTICIAGDGGFMFNIQELQTLVQYDLPVVIFVLNNEGYLTMKHTQKNYFGRLIGADPSSGLSCPDFVKVAAAFGVPGRHIRNMDELEAGLDEALAAKGPFLCELHMPTMQALIPRVQNRRDDKGWVVPTPIEDLYPYLDRDEFADQMIVPPAPT